MNRNQWLPGTLKPNHGLINMIYSYGSKLCGPSLTSAGDLWESQQQR